MLITDKQNGATKGPNRHAPKGLGWGYGGNAPCKAYALPLPVFVLLSVGGGAGPPTEVRGRRAAGPPNLLLEHLKKKTMRNRLPPPVSPWLPVLVFRFFRLRFSKLFR